MAAPWLCLRLCVRCIACLASPGIPLVNVTLRSHKGSDGGGGHALAGNCWNRLAQTLACTLLRSRKPPKKPRARTLADTTPQCEDLVIKYAMQNWGKVDSFSADKAIRLLKEKVGSKKVKK